MEHVGRTELWAYREHINVYGGSSSGRPYFPWSSTGSHEQKCLILCAYLLVHAHTPMEVTLT